MPVTRGNRITVTYNVYMQRPAEDALKTGTSRVLHSGDEKLVQLMDAMRSLRSSPHFAPPGTQLGFFCAHLYPFAMRKRLDAPVLRGTDAALASFLKHEMGFEVSIVPVAALCDNADKYDDDCIRKLQPFSNKASAWLGDGDDRFHASAFERLDLLPNEEPEVFGDEIDHPSCSAYSTELMIGKIDDLRQVVWLNNYDHFNYAFRYGLWGNEQELGFVYVALAMLATIPGQK
jgi:hypothetical protein